MKTDPIADMLTRIRNAIANREKKVKIPHSKVKESIAAVLVREGYVKGFAKHESTPAEGQGPQPWLVVELKYGPEGEQLINHIQRVSRPGRRVYTAVRDLKPIRNGLGIDIVSTSRGVFSNREARGKMVGGEVLARIW